MNHHLRDISEKQTKYKIGYKSNGFIKNKSNFKG